MQADQLKERINRIEQCADDAKRAVQQGSVPNELRQSVDQLHQQARQAKQDANSAQLQMGEDGLKKQVMQLEQTGDKAMQACRTGGNIDPQTQQAVQRAHDEISNLKKQLQMQ
jgi:chromosome segregation ATPase